MKTNATTRRELLRTMAGAAAGVMGGGAVVSAMARNCLPPIGDLFGGNRVATHTQKRSWRKLTLVAGVSFLGSTSSSFRAVHMTREQLEAICSVANAKLQATQKSRP